MLPISASETLRALIFVVEIIFGDRALWRRCVPGVNIENDKRYGTAISSGIFSIHRRYYAGSGRCIVS